MKKIFSQIAVALAAVFAVSLSVGLIVKHKKDKEAAEPKTLVYGVDNVGSVDPFGLKRTDNAVGLSYTIGTSEIQSDFDNCYPWSDMQEVTDDYGNVFIKIPKFYSKITKNEDGTYKHQLSGTKYADYTTLFVDGQGNELDYVLVGKYEASGSVNRAYSVSNRTCLVNVTVSEMRGACRVNGAGYQQYDFLIDSIIKELFVVEMATTNSQSVMYGYVNGGSAMLTGETDSVKTASGSADNNGDGKHSCKYRGIENPWGNVWTWCDGITFSKEKIYICTDPASYTTEHITDSYVYAGDRILSNGKGARIEYFGLFPALGYVTYLFGGYSSYYCDAYWATSDGSVSSPTYGSVLAVGACWSDGDRCGLWASSGAGTASTKGTTRGGRLCYKPIQKAEQPIQEVAQPIQKAEQPIQEVAQ